VGQNNAPPVFRHQVKPFMGGLIFWGLGYWTYQTLWEMPWLGIGIMGWSSVILVPTLWRMQVARSYQRQQQDWAQEAVVHMQGKTASMGKLNDMAGDQRRNKNGAVLGVKDQTVLTYDFFAKGHGHGLCVAPSRTGKSSCVVASTILNAGLAFKRGERFSIFINDPKGENWHITAAFLRSVGMKTAPWNPHGVEDIPSQNTRLLDAVSKSFKEDQGLDAEEITDRFAKAIVPEPPGGAGENLWVTQGAQRFVASLIINMGAFMPDHCHLVTLYQLVMADMDRLNFIANQMQSRDAFRGMLRAHGNSLRNMLDPGFRKTFMAYLSEAQEHVKIYSESSAWAPALTGNDFSIPELFDGETAVFCIMPGSKNITHSGYPSLGTTALIEGFAQHPNPSRLFMVNDEMGNLRIPPDTLKTGLSLLPGKGLRMFNFFQSYHQISALGEEVGNLVIDQSSLHQAFGIGRDLKATEEWSKRCGQTTRKDATYRQNSHDMFYAFEKSFAERQESCLSETEISRMEDSETLIWRAGGYGVLRASLTPYWCIHPFRGLASPNPCEGGGYPPGEDIEYYL